MYIFILFSGISQHIYMPSDCKFFGLMCRCCYRKKTKEERKDYIALFLTYQSLSFGS